MSLLCYNNGCGQKFNENDNGPAACTFHPGQPVFHDAYKGWGCCDKKSIDFTEFLNIKGCTVGYHNPIKPVVDPFASKPKPIIEEQPKVAEIDASFTKPKLMDRPPESAEMIDLKQQLAPNLAAVAAAKAIKPTDNGEVELSPDRECTNGGCKIKYCDRTSTPTCLHHPGQPIFHEGLKYWSCCKKKTMEFDEFMKLKGCQEGEHCWIPQKEVSCRFDWHQTSTHVTISIYSKGYDPNLVKIRANGVKLAVDIVLPDGKFSKEWILFGIINEKESKTSLLTTKVEIVLRKAEPMQWSQLELS